MPPENCWDCCSWTRKAFTITSAWCVPILSAVASPWPSTATNTASFASIKSAVKRAKPRPNSGGPCKSWRLSSCAPIRHRPRDGSSAPTRPSKIASSRKCACAIFPTPSKAMPISPNFIERFQFSICSSHHAVPTMLTAHSLVLENLNHILAWQESRILSKNLTLQFKKVVYQIQTKPPSYALRNAHVTVCEDAQAAISILYQSRELPFTIFHKQEHLAEIVDSKNVDRALPAKTSIPAPDHPWRNPHLFSTPKPASSS